MQKTTQGQVIALLMAIPLQIFGGMVFAQLWLWFIVPTFAAPSLSLPTAIGIQMMSAYLQRGGEIKSDKQAYEKLLRGFSRTIAVLIIGFVISLFIVKQ